MTFPCRYRFVAGAALLLMASGTAAPAVEIPPFWYMYDPASGAYVWGSDAMPPGTAYPNARPIGGLENIDSAANKQYRDWLDMLRRGAKPVPGTPPIPEPVIPPAAPSVPPGTITGGGAVAGYVVVGVLAGVAIYKSGEYYYYAGQLVDNVGSEPAHNLTDYENPANYWDQFWGYYWPQ